MNHRHLRKTLLQNRKFPLTSVRKQAGKPLDENLPRKEKIIDIPEDEKTCACGTELKKIGEEISEKLHVIPPRIWVETDYPY